MEGICGEHNGEHLWLHSNKIEKRATCVYALFLPFLPFLSYILFSCSSKSKTSRRENVSFHCCIFGPHLFRCIQEIKRELAVTVDHAEVNGNEISCQIHRHLFSQLPKSDSLLKQTSMGTYANCFAFHCVLKMSELCCFCGAELRYRKAKTLRYQ